MVEVVFLWAADAIGVLTHQQTLLNTLLSI
jgi:hypothetical protein